MKQMIRRKVVLIYERDDTGYKKPTKRKGI